MIDTPRWTRVPAVAFGVTVVILLVGIILLVQITSRPAYEAIAEMVIEKSGGGLQNAPGFPPQARSPAATELLNREREVLESVSVAQLAAALLTGDARVDWLLAGDSRIADAPAIVCEGCVFDAALVEMNLRIEIPKNSHQIEVRFRADDPTVAREGANAVVYAYAQVRSQDPSIQFGVDFGIPALSLAQTPTRRADRPSGSAVLGFFILATMPVMIPWSRVAQSWQQQAAERPEHPDLGT